MCKLNNKFTFGYLKSAKHRKRSAITTRFFAKSKELHLVTPDTAYWKDVLLPRWVVELKYSAITIWAKLFGKLGGLPVSHLGKSKLKLFQNRTSTFKLIPGGCFRATSQWEDPPIGPPITIYS